MVAAPAHLYRPVLLQGRWFAGLPEDFQTALTSTAVVRRLASNERLFARGDPPNGLFVVVDGAVCVTAITEAGKELMLTRIEAPTWFGEISVFDGQPRTHDTVADGEAVVLQVPSDALQTILDEHPLRWRDLGRLAASKLRLTFHALEDLAGLPLTARLARRLVVLADGHGTLIDDAKDRLHVTQEQLAAMLQCSRQSINAALKELTKQGLVQLAYGAVEIRNHDGLVRLSLGH